MSSLTANIEAVYDRIKRAAARASRQPDEITLVAVTKTHPLETVIAAYQAGLRHFGENRAQEGHEKVVGMSRWLAESGSDPPSWHMIGHLQRRQVGDVLGHFELIHSVDSLKLAERIDRLARRDDYAPVEVLLECNVSGEETKAGFGLDHWQTDQAQLGRFLETIDRINELEKIIIRGLMTMAPLVENPEETRPVFQRLAGLRQKLRQERPRLEWPHLSMGMTDDFEVAIEEGATIVRIGRALFGERLYC